MAFGTAEVRIEADTRDFARDLNRQLRRVGPIEVPLAPPSLRRFRRRLQRQMRRLDVEVRVRADTRRMVRQLERDLRRASRSSTARIRVRADTSGLASQIRAAVRSVPTVTVRVDADTSALRAALTGLPMLTIVPQVNTGPLTRGLGGVGGGAGSVAGAGFAAAFLGATAGIAATLGAALGAVLTTAGGFERELNKVKALTTSTNDEMELLKGTAEDLGSTTRFSAAEAAQGMQELGKAGFDTEKIISAIPEVLNLATAADLSLADSANFLTNAMAAFQIPAKETAKITDQWAAIVTNANADVKGLADGLANVGATASLSGLSLADTSRALATMTDAGIPASEAGTALRNVLDKLAAGGKDVDAALKQANISLKDSEGEARPLIDVIRDLATAELDAADSQKIFGIEGKKALDVIGLNVGRFDALGKAVEESDGAAQDMADTMNTGLSAGMDSLKAAWEGLLIAIGDTGVLEAASRVVGLITQGISSLTNVVSGGGDASGIFDRIGRAAGFARDVLSDFFRRIQPGLQTARELFRSVGETIGRVFADVDFEQLGASIKNAFETAAEQFNTAFTAAKKLFDFLRPAIEFIASVGLQTVIDQLSGAFRTLSGVMDVVSGILNLDFGQIMSGLQDVFGGIVEIITAPFRNLGAAILELLQQAWDGVVNFFTETIPEFASNLGTLLSEALSGALSAAADFVTETVPGLFQGLLDFFLNLPGLIFEGLGALTGLMFSAFLAAFNFVFNTLPQWILRIVQFFADLPGMIGSALGSFAASLWAQFLSAFTFVVSQIPVWTNRIVTFFRNLPGQAASAVSSFGSRVGGVVSRAMDTIRTRVSTEARRIVGVFRNLPGQIRSALSGLQGSIWSGLRSMLNSGIRLVNKFVRGFNRFSPKNVSEIPELADGAIVYQATVAKVGEAGPEVVIPLMAGKAARAEELARSSGLLELLAKRGVIGAPARGGGTVNNRQQQHTWNITTKATDPNVVAQHMYRQMILHSGV